MITFAQNKQDNDINIDAETKSIAIAKDKDACAVIIADAIRTIYGEMQLDNTTGVPYFTTIFESNYGSIGWKSSVMEVVSGFSFVYRIISFDYDIDYSARTLNYTLRVLTEFGIIDIEQTLS